MCSSQVARVWKPASTCLVSTCHINESDANFCQACYTPQSAPGLPSQQRIPTTSTALKSVLLTFNARSTRSLTSDKNPVWRIDFQLSFPRWTLHEHRLRVPRDVVQFFISLDSGGKTLVHQRSCARDPVVYVPEEIGERHVVGKLRAIFNAHGRMGRENPASFRKYVSDQPFMGSAVNNRPRAHFDDAGSCTPERRRIVFSRPWLLL